ncbi:MAG: type I 3-dehydroquinate dehydratase [Eubacterium sp.]|nr:type I 3-dehydroquinate dehydratase [Eubacterium sp.]
MANFKKTFAVKNIEIGNGAYAAFVSISPANAEEMKNQLAEAVSKEEAGVEINLGNMDKVATAVDVLAECKDALAEKIVLMNLNTAGYDCAASDEEKQATAKSAAEYVDIFGADVCADEALLAALKATGKKLMLSYICFEGTKSKDDIIAMAKAAEDKGADLAYLAYIAKDDPDVITIGYASKEIAASDIVSIPVCVWPMGEVGFQTRILSERAGNDFGFYQLVEPEGGLFESYDQYKRMVACYGHFKKLQSPIQYDIDGHVMGGERFLRCMMLKKRTKDDLLAEAKRVALTNPEMVEWRIDYLLPMGTTQFIADYWIDVLKQIKEILPKVPILLTFRVKKEGGLKWYPDSQRLFLTKALINTGLIAYADTEIDNTPEMIKEMQDVCAANGTKLVVSQHKWTLTPSHQEIIDTFKECLEKGSALPKFYLTATNYEDAVRCSEASKEMRETFLQEPCIICAMGDTGLITRTMGGAIGADFEFIDITGIRGGEEEDIHYVDQLAEIFGY